MRRAIWGTIVAASWLVGCGGGPASPVDAGPTDLSAADVSTGGSDLGRDLGCTDADGDGHGAMACGGDDCDDADPLRFPTNPEVCDAAGLDEDCVEATLGPDGDGDGQSATSCCDLQRDGHLVCGLDCDDAEMNVHAGAPESCNGVDDDCDAMVDEGVLTSFYPDCDHDTYGDTTASLGCVAPTTGPSCAGGLWVTVAGDCNDLDAAAHPTAVETCNGHDDDCDGVIDESGTRYEVDCDGDGYGDDMGPVIDACTTPTTTPPCLLAGWIPVTGDCNDGNPLVRPGVADPCNDVDDNCDGTIDPGCTTCDEFCMTDLATCTGANAQYTSMMNCLTTCATWRRGTPREMTGDTLECRAYHLILAMMSGPVPFCSHTGPSGGGACI